MEQFQQRLLCGRPPHPIHHLGHASTLHSAVPEPLQSLGTSLPAEIEGLLGDARPQVDEAKRQSIEVNLRNHRAGLLDALQLASLVLQRVDVLLEVAQDYLHLPRERFHGVEEDPTREEQHDGRGVYV